MGRRRNRGGSRDARAAGVDADSRSRGLQAFRAASAWIYRDGSRSHGDPDAASEESRGKVRRVLWYWTVQPSTRRPRDDREHVSRVRGDDGLLPRGRRDTQVPPPLWTPGASRQTGRSVLQGAGTVPHGRHSGSSLLRRATARSWNRGTLARGSEASAGSRAAEERERDVSCCAEGGSGAN